MTKPPSRTSNGVVPRTSRTTAAAIQPILERRMRSVADKLRMLEEDNACPVGSLARGAVLRREGSYTSHISKWRKQLQRRMLADGPSGRRGRAPTAAEALRDELARLRQENARLHARLERAEAISDVHTKVAHLLGTTIPSPPGDAP